VFRRQLIAINKQFPGPIINVTTNDNVVVNVLNSLDEPLLITWSGLSLPPLPPPPLHFLNSILRQVNQERHPAEKELLAGWGSGHRLPHTARLELDLQLPSQGPDWELLLLPAPHHAARRWWFRRYHCQQPGCHLGPLRHTRWRYHVAHWGLVQEQPHGTAELSQDASLTWVFQ
jgi:hypothetical protein